MLFKKEIVSQGEKMACQIYPRAFLVFSPKAQVIALCLVFACSMKLTLKTVIQNGGMNNKRSFAD